MARRKHVNEDGLDIPAFLRIPSEQRKKAWEGVRLHSATPSLISEKSEAQVKQEEMRRAKERIRLDELNARKRREREAKEGKTTGKRISALKSMTNSAKPSPYHRWDPTRARWMLDPVFKMRRALHGEAVAMAMSDPPKLKRKKPKKQYDRKPRKRMSKFNDDIAQFLVGATPEEIKAAAKRNKVWSPKYDDLPNPGLVRMTVGNKLRNLRKKGTKVVL